MSFAMPISKNDDLNSSSNPIHVVVENTPEVVTNVHAYKKTSVSGSGSIDNHDYTVVGTSFRLRSVILSSQSKFEGEVKTGPLASLVTHALGIVNTSTMTTTITFDPPIIVPSTGTGTVRVVRRRFSSGTDDVHTTIIGEDIA